MSEPIKTILVCTVGGSHDPILTAIRQTCPHFVCFISSGKDPATGSKGSEVQITGEGNIIKAHPAHERPTLPNIPSQAGLAEGTFDIIIVPADDLDRAFIQVKEKLQSLRRSFPNSRILADYTGGTKTMTAALVTAAIETEAIDLQLVTGSRADLNRVASGTEYGTPASVERIRTERAMSMCLKAWERFGYGEAALGLSRIANPTDAEIRGRLQMARDLSRAFDAWDRFDHSEAVRLIDIYRPRVGAKLGGHLTALKCLTQETEKQEPARILDLWLNAQRCAERRRYDDAVARIYRLLEWTAQYLLRSRCNIDTSDVPCDRLADDITLPVDRKGRMQAGLFDAWRLVEKHVGGEPLISSVRRKT